jgi:hypothetical protein
VALLTVVVDTGSAGVADIPFYTATFVPFYK